MLAQEGYPKREEPAEAAAAAQKKRKTTKEQTQFCFPLTASSASALGLWLEPRMSRLSLRLCVLSESDFVSFADLKCVV